MVRLGLILKGKTHLTTVNACCIGTTLFPSPHLMSEVAELRRSSIV